MMDGNLQVSTMDKLNKLLRKLYSETFGHNNKNYIFRSHGDVFKLNSWMYCLKYHFFHKMDRIKN